ncbi:hypothetical protein REPUB_Repub12eG0046100 [Reevesia pubescens]
MQAQGSKPIIPTGNIFIYSYKNIKHQTEDQEVAKECAICLEELKEGDLCRILSNCKHLYHLSCIDRWLFKEPCCPLCRGSIHASGSTHALLDFFIFYFFYI